MIQRVYERTSEAIAFDAAPAGTPIPSEEVRGAANPGDDEWFRADVVREDGASGIGFDTFGMPMLSFEHARELAQWLLAKCDEHAVEQRRLQ